MKTAAAYPPAITVHDDYFKRSFFQKEERLKRSSERLDSQIPQVAGYEAV